MQHVDRHETIDDLENYTFTFNEWDYRQDHNKGDRLIKIGGLIGKKTMLVTSMSRVEAPKMYKRFFKKLLGYVQKKWIHPRTT